MESTFSNQAQTVATLVVFVVTVLAILIGVAITLLIWCRLFAKAGYSWALGLLVLVPVANIIVPFYLAFADWPIQKELRQLRQRCGTAPA